MPVYQENENKWTKDGRKWYFKVYYTDMYGKRKRKRSKLYLMKRDAIEAESEFLIKIKTIDETDNNIKFDTVYNEWLVYKSHTVKNTTFHGIKMLTNKYIYSKFKGINLHNIKVTNINLWYDFLETEKCTVKYKNVIVSYFKELLNYAFDNYDFDKKIVAKLVKFRNDIIVETKKDSEINFWTYEEFKKFIKFVDNDFYYLVFNFLYFTGLRKGEMFALNWEDLDFKNKKLKINKQCNSKAGLGTYQITTPKTSNSNRIIDIDDELINLLKEHYEKQNNIYNFNNKQFIFGGITPLSATTLARNLKYYIKKANVKQITPHGFRHSHVSLLINLGCDARDVANRIGDTVQIVESTYYHLFPDKKAATIDLINKLKKNRT